MLIKSRKKRVLCPADTAKIFSEILSVEDKEEQEKEHFWVMGLNSRNLIEYIDLVSLGTLTCNIVHPRETFRRAISCGNIVGIVMCHNHPSGDSAYSNEDKLCTERIIKAGDILGIPLMDSVTIGVNASYTSMRYELPDMFDDEEGEVR